MIVAELQMIVVLCWWGYSKSCQQLWYSVNYDNCSKSVDDVGTPWLVAIFEELGMIVVLSDWRYFCKADNDCGTLQMVILVEELWIIVVPRKKIVIIVEELLITVAFF